MGPVSAFASVSPPPPRRRPMSSSHPLRRVICAATAAYAGIGVAISAATYALLRERDITTGAVTVQEETRWFTEEAERRATIRQHMRKAE